MQTSESKVAADATDKSFKDINRPSWQLPFVAPGTKRSTYVSKFSRCETQHRPNLPTDPEASRERFATCHQPHGNREGPTFHFANIGRTESRPSWRRRRGCFFAHLSYSLRTARLASSFFMIADRPCSLPWKSARLGRSLRAPLTLPSNEQGLSRQLER